MTDSLDLRLEAWMREQGAFTAVDAAVVVDGLALRPRARRLRFGRSTVAGVGLAFALVAVAGLGVAFLSRGDGPVGRPMPPDPRAFAGDARFARCGVRDERTALYAFELAHASDFPVAFPSAGRAPELERPDPAFVLVLPPDGVNGQGGGAWVPGSPSPAVEGGQRVCVVVGAGADAEVNLYSDVDLGGFDPDGVRTLGPASPGDPAPSPTPTATESPPAVTPLPAEPTPDPTAR